MGEIAEGLINGDFDFFTGEYIGHGKGFPRTITGRNRGHRFRERKFTDHQKMKGVFFYLHDKGFKSQSKAIDVIMEFCLFAGIELPNKRRVKYACCRIQDNFKIFLNWFYERYNVVGRNPNNEQRKTETSETSSNKGQ